MIKMLSQAAMLAACGFALGACTPQTTAPAKKPPAADYQAEVPPPPPAASIKAICYNEADLSTFRTRMVQGEFAVATLQCQNAGGARAFESIYASFLNKYTAELTANAQSLRQVAARKRFNVDVVVTEMSNRMAQRAPVDREFCTRSLRALEWALDPKATSLTLVPPPYDMGPEMNIIPCPQ